MENAQALTFLGVMTLRISHRFQRCFSSPGRVQVSLYICKNLTSSRGFSLYMQFLELIKMEGFQDENSLSGTQEVFVLQLCSGLEEAGAGSCPQMVFAPIDTSISDDVQLMPSGFRILPLEDGHLERTGKTSRLLDLASALEVGGATALQSNEDMEDSNTSVMKKMRSVLSMAFQFNFEGGMERGAARMATHYVRNVVWTLHRLALALAPPSPRLPLPPSDPPSEQHLMLAAAPPNVLPQEDLNLARWICRSYKMNVGMDLLYAETEKSQDYLKAVWKLKDALLCCACKMAAVFTFANQAGLEMLEVPCATNLSEIPCTKTILEDDPGKGGMRAVVVQVMQQGYTCLPAGIRISSKGRAVSYERAIAWKVVVQVEEELTIHGVAFLFTNWSFLHDNSSSSTASNNNMKLGEEDTLQAPLLLC